MHTNPIYHFDDENDTGINRVPLDALIVINDASNQSVQQLQKIDNGNLTDTSTIEDFLNNSALYKNMDFLAKDEIPPTLSFDFDATANQTDFVYPNQIFSEADIFKNGLLIRETDYTISDNGLNTTISFNNPLADGDWVKVKSPSTNLSTTGGGVGGTKKLVFEVNENNIGGDAHVAEDNPLPFNATVRNDENIITLEMTGEVTVNKSGVYILTFYKYSNYDDDRIKMLINNSHRCLYLGGRVYRGAGHGAAIVRLEAGDQLSIQGDFGDLHWYSAGGHNAFSGVYLGE
jgi:hypothetical protein